MFKYENTPGLLELEGRSMLWNVVPPVDRLDSILSGRPGGASSLVTVLERLLMMNNSKR